MPPNAYVNPPFAASPALDPNSFAQAMSFMATPAGAQSMAAFASHMANAGDTPAQLSQPQYTTQNYPPPQSSHKRKRDDRRSNTSIEQAPHRHPQQQGFKPPRAKVAIPPPVPTFGFALPAPPPAAAPSRAKDNSKGKVRLGLTRQEVPDESSEEEDIDEEVALGAKLKGGGFAFEHQGEHISIQTTGDIAEWIKDRKRNFPTYQKAVEKAQAAASKRKNELEFVRKLKGKPVQPDIAPREKAKPKAPERSQKEEKKREELAALRKKLHESMVKKEATTVDLGVGYGSATESDPGESSVLSDSSVVSSSEESSDDSDNESNDSDAPPEAASSKIAPLPINVPRPLPAPIRTEPKSTKEKMFKHPYREEKRTGLYEKLVEQELVKADQLALDAIKYLGQNGFLG
ncbi:hypothetical protein DE146DRAFT_625537 [Phaeosphaeria sp. MPI-PUGE-AT-0046c]|nr:hypothetical protein DE146DRAFT_625537 [Phaeosphaeria sp. MPI-PUGE-AT-0046c]